MMKKTVAIAFLYLVATLALQARTPRLEFGVEWGYCPALFYWNHLEYLTDDQYFIRRKGRDSTSPPAPSSGFMPVIRASTGDCGPFPSGFRRHIILQEHRPRAG